MQKLVTIVTTAVITAGLVLTVQVMADSNPATDGVPRRIPYKGTLEKDGVAYTGTMSMTFSIYDGGTATTASWTETQTATVYGGKFEVLLGAASTTSATSLDTLVKNGDDLYMSITLNTTDGDVVLSNKQRFYPVPYSTWATAAADFKVGGGLTVTGTSVLTGAVTAKAGATTYGVENDGSTGSLVVGNASGTGSKIVIDDDEIDATSYSLKLNSNSKKDVVTGGKLTVGTYLSMGGSDFYFDTHADRGDGGRALVHDYDDVLTINYAGDLGDKTQIQSTDTTVKNLSASGTLSATGATTLTGTASVGSTLTVSGSITPSTGSTSSYGINWAENIGGGSGDIAYIRYYAETDEDTKLVIGVDNDSNDDLVLYQKGAERIQLASGEIYVLATKLSYGSCPTNYTLWEGVCYRRYSSKKAWLDAQYTCHTEGGHVCTMAETYTIWGTGGCSQVHQNNDWLGDMDSDDNPFYVNNYCNHSNFEDGGDRNKTDTYPFVCCMNLR